MLRIVTDRDIQALLDNELDKDDAKRVRLYIQEHSWARDRYQALQAQNEVLKRWYVKKEHE